MPTQLLQFTFAYFEHFKKFDSWYFTKCFFSCLISSSDVEFDSVATTASGGITTCGMLWNALKLFHKSQSNWFLLSFMQQQQHTDVVVFLSRKSPEDFRVGLDRVEWIMLWHNRVLSGWSKCWLLIKLQNF